MGQYLRFEKTLVTNNEEFLDDVFEDSPMDRQYYVEAINKSDFRDDGMTSIYEDDFDDDFLCSLKRWNIPFNLFTYYADEENDCVDFFRPGFENRKWHDIDADEKSLVPREKLMEMIQSPLELLKYLEEDFFDSEMNKLENWMGEKLRERTKTEQLA